jgi:hypothetical protein
MSICTDSWCNINKELSRLNTIIVSDPILSRNKAASLFGEIVTNEKGQYNNTSNNFNGLGVFNKDDSVSQCFI